MRLKDFFRKIRDFFRKKPNTVEVKPLPTIFAPIDLGSLDSSVPEPGPTYQAPILPKISPEWPPGTTEFQPGVYYVGQNGPFKTVQEYYDWQKRVADRDANLKREQEQREGTFYNGRFSTEELTNDELAYVRFRSHDYKLQTNRDLFFDLFRGYYADVNRVKQKADILNPGMNFMATTNQVLELTINWLFERNR